MLDFRSINSLYPQKVKSKITVFCAAAKNVREATTCLGVRRVYPSAALGKFAVSCSLLTFRLFIYNSHSSVGCCPTCNCLQLSIIVLISTKQVYKIFSGTVKLRWLIDCLKFCFGICPKCTD